MRHIVMIDFCVIVKLQRKAGACSRLNFVAKLVARRFCCGNCSFLRTVLLLCNSGRTVPTNCVVRTNRNAVRFSFSSQAFSSGRRGTTTVVDEVSEFCTAKTASTSSASFLGTFPTGEGLGVCEQTTAPRGFCLLLVGAFCSRRFRFGIRFFSGGETH